MNISMENCKAQVMIHERKAIMPAHGCETTSVDQPPTSLFLGREIARVNDARQEMPTNHF